MGGPSTPDKELVLDALLLAFSYSGFDHERESLRSMLAVEFYEVVQDGEFDMQELWEVLEDLPGFSSQSVSPPLLQFAMWEARLGLTMKLPEALAGLAPPERSKLAAACKVPPQELQRIFRAPAKKKKTSAITLPGIQPEATASPEQSKQHNRRKMIAMVATLGALIGFSFAGLTLFQNCSGAAQWQELKVPTSEIPLKDGAQALGKSIVVTLSDDLWASDSESDRSPQLEQLLRNVRQSRPEIDSLIVKDSAGGDRAIAQFVSDSTGAASDTVQIRFVD